MIANSYRQARVGSDSKSRPTQVVVVTMKNTTATYPDRATLQAEVHAWLVPLTPAEKVERLKQIGILDSKGKLSSTYGGSGAATRDRSDPQA